MQQSSFARTKIVYAVEQIELGIPTHKIARKHGVSDKTVHLERRRREGGSPSELKWLKQRDLAVWRPRRNEASLRRHRHEAGPARSSDKALVDS